MLNSLLFAFLLKKNCFKLLLKNMACYAKPFSVAVIAAPIKKPARGGFCIAWQALGVI